MEVVINQKRTVTIKHDITDTYIEQIFRNQKSDSLIGDGYSEYIARIRLYEKQGPAFAAVTETDIVIALGGIISITPGVGHVWLTLSTEALRRPKSLLKVCKLIFKEMVQAKNYHRVQADIDITQWDNIRFVERHDFNFEGVMKAYGPNKEDFYRYAWIKGVPGNRKLTKLIKERK